MFREGKMLFRSHPNVALLASFILACVALVGCDGLKYQTEPFVSSIYAIKADSFITKNAILDEFYNSGFDLEPYGAPHPDFQLYQQNAEGRQITIKLERNKRLSVTMYLKRFGSSAEADCRALAKLVDAIVAIAQYSDIELIQAAEQNFEAMDRCKLKSPMF